MAWTTPRTWSSGELVGASQLNEQIRDNLGILKSAVNNSGKIVALTATYLESVDGTALTGLALLAGNNDWTSGTQNFNGGVGTRLVIPVGSSKWAT